MNKWNNKYLYILVFIIACLLAFKPQNDIVQNFEIHCKSFLPETFNQKNTTQISLQARHVIKGCYASINNFTRLQITAPNLNIPSLARIIDYRPLLGGGCGAVFLVFFAVIAAICRVLWICIVWIATIIWAFLCWLAKVTWPAICWTARIIWIGICWTARIIWVGLRWLARVIWPAICWAARILWTGICWLARMLWVAMRWIGMTMWRAVVGAWRLILSPTKSFGKLLNPAKSVAPQVSQTGKIVRAGANAAVNEAKIVRTGANAAVNEAKIARAGASTATTVATNESKTVSSVRTTANVKEAKTTSASKTAAKTKDNSATQQRDASNSSEGKGSDKSESTVTNKAKKSETNNVTTVPTKTGLKPNAEYNSNGYTYVTDSQGRVVEASGKLKSNPGVRSPENQKTAAGWGAPGDDGGHLVAAQFGGPGDLCNHVPQNMNVNRSVIKRIENEMASFVKQGKEVNYKISVHYSGDALRPDRFRIQYDVDGVKTIRTVKNVE